LFLAAPGALKPLRSVCGYDPATAAVEDIEQATALVRKAAKDGRYDAIIVDDLSFLAEQTFAKTEKKASGFRLWGLLRDIVLDFRDACRLEAKCHVIVNCWEQVPTQKQDGTKVRGGPLLSGKLPEQLPAMCDKVYRAAHDPNRKPWPSIYRCFLDPNYVMKDRDGIVDPAPMNLSEILRDGGYVVRRHPSLEWQEAIVEDLDAKRELFARARAAAPEALLASNSSVIPISRIAEGLAGAHRTVGMHWWNPPDLIPIVEVIRGEHTSTESMDTACEVLDFIGKIPVRVQRDVPGFVGNRLQHALWREAIDLVATGVCDAETVDLVVRNTIGLRLAAMGPIENADYVGLDLTLAIHDQVLPSINSDPHASPLLRHKVASGELGATSGQGFLTWPGGSRDSAADRLAAHISQKVKT
jgi:3-hydroxybutyryl-CoA dehydrogenase